VFGHDTPLAFGKQAQLKIADADSYQAQHRNIEGAEQAAYVPVPALIERNFKPGVLLTASQATYGFGAEQFSLDIGTPIEYRDQRRIRHSVYLHVVGLVRPRRGVSHVSGPRRVVAE